MGAFIRSGWLVFLCIALASCQVMKSSGEGSFDSPGASRSADRETVERQIHWDGMPGALQDLMLTQLPAHVASPNLTWRKETISVAFEDGSDELYELIELVANEWTQSNSRIRFSFKDTSGQYRKWYTSDSIRSADIRISFRSGAEYGGYWSMLGVLGLNIRASDPTMNLERFPDKLSRYYQGRNPEEWRKSYYRVTILHEFGHALGLSHEHFHPNCQSDLDIDRAVGYLMRTNSWSETTARFNVDLNFYRQQMQRISKDAGLNFSRKIDQESVMLYSFPREVVSNGSRCEVQASRGFATNLSEADKRAFQLFYSNP